MLLGVAAVLVAAAAVTVVVVLTGEEPEPPPRRAAESPTATAGPELCRDAGGRHQLVVQFTAPDPDDDMRRAARRLDGDPRIAELEAKTRQEVWADFVEAFEDSDPELTDTVDPEDLPATLALLPEDGTTVTELATDLRDEIDAPTQYDTESGCKLGG